MTERRIIGFHCDEHGDWVADLECGHTRHVRHNPPWEERPWVESEVGRAQFLGYLVRCKECEMQEAAPGDAPKPEL